MDRDLAHSKDPQGNSLLHIAAKNRSRELFAFILKRAGPNSLTVKNNVYLTSHSLAGPHWTWLNCTGPIVSFNCVRPTLPISDEGGKIN